MFVRHFYTPPAVADISKNFTGAEHKILPEQYTKFQGFGSVCRFRGIYRERNLTLFLKKWTPLLKLYQSHINKFINTFIIFKY